RRRAHDRTAIADGVARGRGAVGVVEHAVRTLAIAEPSDRFDLHCQWIERAKCSAESFVNSCIGAQTHLGQHRADESTGDYRGQPQVKGPRVAKDVSAASKELKNQERVNADASDAKFAQQLEIVAV